MCGVCGARCQKSLIGTRVILGTPQKTTDFTDFTDKMGMTKIAFTTWTQPSDILGSCHSCCKVQSRVYLRFGQTLPLLASNLNPEETTADNIPLMQAGVQRCSLVQKNSSTGEKSRFVLAKSIQFLVFFVSSSAPNQQVLPLPKHLVAF